MDLPGNLHYSDDHEWIEAVSGVAKVGITEFAARALGDIVYVQLPEKGTQIVAGEPCGEIESTKAVSELYAPASGTVTAINEAVVANPSLLNADPYQDGWLYEVEVGETLVLMSAAEYSALIKPEHHDQFL